MSSNTSTTTASSDPQLDQDIAQYQAQQAATAAAYNQMYADAASATTMMDAINLLYEMMDCLGNEIIGFADVLNILSDMTNQNAQAENDFSGMMNTATTDPTACANYAADYCTQINGIAAYTQELADDGIIDQDTANTIISSCTSIQDAFGDDWNNPDLMASQMQEWMTDATSGSGTYPAQINNIQQSQQQIETSLSSLTQTTQYQVQEKVTEAQNLGSTINATQNSWSQWTSQEVKNQAAS